MMNNASESGTDGEPETVVPAASAAAGVEAFEGGNKRRKKGICSFPEMLFNCWETSISNEQCGIIPQVLPSLFCCAHFL